MRQRGFTLVEILVALIIMGVLFAIGYGTLNQAIRNREHVQQRQDRLVALQRTVRLLVQDFAQLAPRPVRDPLGTTFEPAVLSGGTRGVVVTLTRGGWSNPAGVQRATLQRVRYALNDGKLRREAFPVLDATAQAQPRGRDLLDGVKSIAIRYLDDGKTWRETWPPAALAANPAQAGALPRWRPVAVEVTLELEDWGRIQRLIEVTQ